MRQHKSLVPVLVVALATGCIAPPGRDARWRSSGGSAYAESQRRKATATTAVGFGVMGLGVLWGALGLANLAAVDSDDTLTDSDKDAGRAVFGAFAAVGGAIALVGLIWGAQQADVRSQWSDQLRGRSRDYGALPDWSADFVTAHRHLRVEASAKASEGGRSGADPSVAVRGRLFVPEGAPLPQGSESLEVIRVGGPADPAVVALAARVPVLRWPVLILDTGAGHAEKVLVGADAIAGARRVDEERSRGSRDPGTGESGRVARVGGPRLATGGPG